jgi:hypothetical protein
MRRERQTDVAKLIVLFAIIWTSLQTELTEIFCDDVGGLNLPNIG